jgi:hypothetical protein
MITYKLPEEKEMLLRYAKLLKDAESEKIIDQGEIRNKHEATHLAEFYWRMVTESNNQDESSGENSEYILEKIIITLMGHYRSSGFEEEWEEVSNRS